MAVLVGNHSTDGSHGDCILHSSALHHTGMG